MRDAVMRCDVAVVGGGPAGVAAACRAAESGADVVLVDEADSLGGQVFRRSAGKPPPARARGWLERFERSGAAHVARATVFDLESDDAEWRLHVDDDPTGRRVVVAERVVLATGARERLLPFPGWTLPGVMGAGGAQALLKAGMSVRGLRVVVAGTGPLLVPVASALAHAGARVELVAEQAPLVVAAVFGATLVGRPSKLLEAVGYRNGAPAYRTGTWITAAAGRGRVESVVVRTRRDVRRVACDLLCTSYGLVPNTELARLAGCATDASVVHVDAEQATSVAGLFCAGEPTGIAGVEAAVVEGEIAGLAAAGAFDAATRVGRQLARARDLGRRDADRLARAFGLRTEVRSLARADTIVCRCEDVALGELDAAWSPREAKLATRAGMGACQARVCGPALEVAFGWSADRVRMPVKPVALERLIKSEEE